MYALEGGSFGLQFGGEGNRLRLSRDMNTPRARE